VDVEEHRHLALSRAQRGEGPPELIGGGVQGGGPLGIGGVIVGDEAIDCLVSRVAARGGDVQRPDDRAVEALLVAAQLAVGEPERSGQLGARRRPPFARVEAVARPLDAALEPPQRARGPVLAAQLVEDGAVDAGPQVLLQEAPRSGWKRSSAPISASKPTEMKSSTSQRAGIERNFRSTRYLTSGAQESTSWSRATRSPP